MSRKIIKFSAIDSTHSHALRLIGRRDISKYPDGCVLIADTQTIGVGRCHRRWVSPPGNLYTSILSPIPPSEDFCQLSLTIGCAARETIRHFLRESNFLRLHWPNDVYYGNRKICGILAASTDGWLIISVGINVNVSPDIGSAVSLKDILGDDVPKVPDVLDVLLKNVDDWLCLLRHVGFFRIRNYWLQNVNEISSRVVVRNGKESIVGIFCDLDERGRLVLEKEDGERLFISSGDLFVNSEIIMVSYE
ncbi:MAG: biotin--[acetyl-CoA-carboxylase] ligase [Holosporaceae bacterium]|jgi:BirA family biotin operon repressor/biotin-[acetyl-CoA-carboxylase] ligase|nr:biotin--[acetyl-CoA-carboxylase] ligase [Holosporaceae bacterium]